MIIDAQVHAWLPDTPERPWPGDGAARAQLPDALDDTTLLGLMDEAGVDRVVIVPPSWEGNRNDHALDGAAEPLRCQIRVNPRVESRHVRAPSPRRA